MNEKKIMTAIANALARNKYREALQAYLDLERSILQILVNTHYKKDEYKKEFGVNNPVLLPQLVTHILVSLAFQHTKKDQTIEWYKKENSLAELIKILKTGKLSIFNINEIYEKAVRICLAYTDQEMQYHTAYTFFDTFSSEIYATGAYSTELTWFVTLLLIKKLFKIIIQREPNHSYLKHLENKITSLEQQLMNYQNNNQQFVPHFVPNLPPDDDMSVTLDEEEDYQPLKLPPSPFNNDIQELNLYRLIFWNNDDDVNDFAQEKNNVQELLAQENYGV